MATATLRQFIPRAAARPPRPKLACFSFAAYAKTVVDHLRSLDIPVLPGLSDQEFYSIESTFHFSFPPDLRSILQEGLPIGPGFPNWRSSSFQQLHILINLPSFSLLKEVSERSFWSTSWGPEPDDPSDARALAKQFLDSVPVLVPVYRNCYIPSSPNMAGNPVFYVDRGEIRILSFDLAGFFNNDESFRRGESGFAAAVDLPAWAAKEPREVVFWTEVAERGKSGVARGATRGWWNDGVLELGLEGCLEEVFWKLREGGWREDEVREMMMMDGQDEAGVRSEPAVEALLDAGWTTENSVDLEDDDDDSPVATPEEESTFEINLEHPMRSFHVEASRINKLMHHHGPHFHFGHIHQNLIL